MQYWSFYISSFQVLTLQPGILFRLKRNSCDFLETIKNNIYLELNSCERIIFDSLSEAEELLKKRIEKHCRKHP